MAIELLAPAKLNLTLEVLRRRDDGYHEIVSVMQTIALADRVRIEAAAGLGVVVTGETAAGVPDEVERNLAYRAAVALAREAGIEAPAARIELEKSIPAGAGLGGGSSDAAAVLRGLNWLWALELGIERLAAVGATLGSDVPFFLSGGTALATGRGEVIEALPEVPARELTLFLFDGSIEDKTRSMYGSLTAADFTSGESARAFIEALRADESRTSGTNVFDVHVAAAVPAAGEAMATCREAGVEVLVCGSGPSFFSLTERDALPAGLVEALTRRFGVHAVGTRTLSRDEALAVQEA